MSGVFQNIDPPPLFHPASVSSPHTKGGGLYTRRQRWVKGPIDRSSNRFDFPIVSVDVKFGFLYRAIVLVHFKFRFLYQAIVWVLFKSRFFHRPILFLGFKFRFLNRAIVSVRFKFRFFHDRSYFLILSSDFCIG